jgi:hypothetical protein
MCAVGMITRKDLLDPVVESKHSKLLEEHHMKKKYADNLLPTNTVLPDDDIIDNSLSRSPTRSARLSRVMARRPTSASEHIPTAVVPIRVAGVPVAHRDSM